SKKTSNAPEHAPIHEKRKPHHSPKAFAFAMTNRNNGKNGKKASTIGNKIPGSGPNDLYCSIKSMMFSIVNHSLIESKSILFPYSFCHHYVDKTRYFSS